MVYNEGKNKYFQLFHRIRFFDTRLDIFSYFTGYEHTLLDKVDEGKIKGFEKLLQIITRKYMNIFSIGSVILYIIPTEKQKLPSS